MSEYTMKLPDVGEGVAEAEIVEWHVAVGDTITEDDVLVDVMSDKATVELSSPVSGVVRWLAGEVGAVLPVGSTLLRIDIDGTEANDPPEATSESTSDAPTEALPATNEPASDAEPVRSAGTATAAPAVRARARALGLDLGALIGSGPDGRVVHADLDAVLTSGRAASSSVPTRGGPGAAGLVDEAIRITGLRRNIAERVQESKRRIPHFTYVDEIDVTELERFRHGLNDRWSGQRAKLSLLPFLMRAVILGVRTHPEMNARFDDEAGVVHRHGSVHLGIATQTDRGLMVPVVQQAEALDLWASANEVARLADAARSAKITLDELTGSTITITSLGALGGIVTTPVINTPEVAIVGVNKISERPVYSGDTIVRRSMMNLSSSFDHRVIDGADAAAFIQEIKRVLETPALLFVD